ncbi:MAG: hypothetical protein HN533_00825 [Euryarchaeota archaeon]|nr:hypothetical protein [Euryarchaeota archaeon]MBT6874612.1 hypothetical protein [Euryarchaeota archaeon]
MDINSAVDFLRLLLLYSCLLVAAKSDISKFLVKNKHWIYFSPFAIILLILDMILSKSSIWNIFMIFTLVSIAAASLGIVPNIKQITTFNLINYCIIICYILGFMGVINGILQYTQIDYYSLILQTESHNVTLWWTLVFASISMIFYIFVWRYGLIQGGADVKALIWTTLLIPSWAFIPQPYIYQTTLIESESIIVQLPPSFVLFLWGSSVFIVAPFIYLIRNILENNIKSLSDLKVAWHARKVLLSEISGNKFWILSEVIMDDNKQYIDTKNRILPDINNENKTIQERIDEFKKYDIEKIWITKKYPFIGYLFFAIFPLIIFGDPITIILTLI